MSVQESDRNETAEAEPGGNTTEATAGVTAAPTSPQHPPRALRRRRVIGIMGGTFDPIHHGHLVAASEVMDVYGLDQVVFVPTAMQPFKAGRRVTSAEHRYLMTVIATASNPRFAVSRVDIDRGGTTFTIDTLADLSREYPDSDFYFITGADALAQIAQWKDSDTLFEQAHFIGVTRPGHNLSDPGLPHESVSLLEVPAMAISSTDCRSRVEEGKPVWYLVPDGVVQYINKYGLYRS
ncbi:nicotinate-nucleotide adenylyltransferase [Schaalia meyeri]|uniref:Probable nicotinate-nucleotide adenylyltransferase n=1 Tax=Schaalia meyeri TaxID=52773 RepID=A0AAP9Y853_9ACTO|nr:nicotinate-nucleotide adenylyltransferase [Schaalia meyeri]QQC44578.1 nicotinate-nucleotide adenylyltransferase [Schaalia meyeri]SDR64569.1 nicotinate-nucleotide adenylyltransferase [Schaalia meyeri]